MKNNLDRLQIFSIWNDSVTKQNRVDVEYYQPYFNHIVAKISKTKFELKKLGDITTFVGNGRTPAKDKYVESGEQDGAKPIIKAATASGKFVNLDKLGYASKDVSLGEKVQKNDIFILSAAHQAQYVGKNVSILETEPQTDTSFVGELICARADTSQCLPEYLFSILSSKTGYLLLNREKRGQTSHIYPSDIKEILLPVPPLDEQKKIVIAFNNAYTEKRKKEAKAKEILNSIDDFVLSELGIKLESEKEQMTFQIWSDEIKMRIDPSFFRPLFETLDNAFATTKYKTGVLSNLSSKITSGATPLSKGDAYTNADIGVPFVRSGDINTDNKIDFNDVLYLKPKIHDKKLKGSKLQKGDLLIAIVGATIGQISVYDYDKEANINQAIALVRLDKQKINSEYAKEFMFSSIGQMQLERIKRPVARANINLDEVGSMKIIYPTKQKQDEMVKKIQEKRARVSTLRTEADDLVANAQKQVEQMILA